MVDNSSFGKYKFFSKKGFSGRLIISIKYRETDFWITSSSFERYKDNSFVNGPPM
jgi:hypothetical protein